MGNFEATDRDQIETFVQSIGFSDVPGLLDKIVDLVIARMDGLAGRPRLSQAHRIARQAEMREAGRQFQHEGAARFMAKRCEVQADHMAPLKFSHAQYFAYCVANNIPPLGKTLFDRWLTDQGFTSFKLQTTTGPKPYKNGFRVRPDPAIDPAPAEVDVPLDVIWDWDYVKPSEAARDVGLASAKIYSMIASGLVKTKTGMGKRPLVYMPDVLAHAQSFRPEPYRFPVMGDVSTWLDERTRPAPQSRMPHYDAYPDYCIWCGNRAVKPIQEDRFKNAVGAKYSRTKVKGVNKLAYFGVELMG